MIFIGDRIAMASATFGDDMWSCRGVGLSRVLTTIRMRNTKPVVLVLEVSVWVISNMNNLIEFYF